MTKLSTSELRQGLREGGLGERKATDKLSRRLILLAHGSRDPQWRAPFEKLITGLLAEPKALPVHLAYVEFAQPSLLQVARECAEMGAQAVQVLPLFLAAGAHLADDVPGMVEEIRHNFPSLQVEVLPPLGTDPRMQFLIHMLCRERALRLLGLE